MTDKCRCLHMHMIKVLEWHGYLETHCLNLQNIWKRWARTSVTIYTRERLRLKRIIHHECPSELSIQEFAFVFKIWKPSKLQEERNALILGDKFWGSIDESDDVSHLESKVCKESCEIILMHSLSSWNQSSLFSRPYCSGRAKSGCGGVLAVNIDDFRRQRSAWFHEI